MPQRVKSSRCIWQQEDATSCCILQWGVSQLLLLQYFFSYIFLGFFCVYMYLCRPSEASTRYCVIPGGYPPQDWQSLPCAGEELDSNPGLLICSQVHYHWAPSPPKLSHLSSWLSHLSSWLSHLSSCCNMQWEVESHCYIHYYIMQQGVKSYRCTMQGVRRQGKF